jgi:hypothetical protein
MSLFTIDLIIRNNDNIILCGNRNDRTRYNILIQKYSLNNINNINNINNFCFYNPHNNSFYYAQFVDDRFVENINNNHIHNYIWNELNGTTERNFNSDIYGIPREFFNYIIGIIYLF